MGDREAAEEAHEEEHEEDSCEGDRAGGGEGAQDGSEVRAAGGHEKGACCGTAARRQAAGRSLIVAPDFSKARWTACMCSRARPGNVKASPAWSPQADFWLISRFDSFSSARTMPE